MTQDIPQQVVDSAAGISVAAGALSWIEATQGWIDIVSGTVAIVTGCFAISFYIKRWRDERKK